jgi:hypothetical protein
MTDQPLPDTWHSRDLPVLRTIVRLHDADPIDLVRVNHIESELAGTLSEDDIQRAGIALEEAGLIDISGSSGLPLLFVKSITANARQLAGSWPTADTAADRLLAALDALAAQSHDEPTRTRARTVREQVGGFSRDTLAAIAATVITGQIPGSQS